MGGGGAGRTLKSARLWRPGSLQGALSRSRGWDAGWTAGWRGALSRRALRAAISADGGLLGAASAAAGSPGSPPTTPHARRGARQLDGGAPRGRCARPPSRDARPIVPRAPPAPGPGAGPWRAPPRRCAPPASGRAKRPGRCPRSRCPACVPATPPTPARSFYFRFGARRPDRCCSRRETAARPGGPAPEEGNCGPAGAFVFPARPAAAARLLPPSRSLFRPPPSARRLPSIARSSGRRDRSPREAGSRALGRPDRLRCNFGERAVRAPRIARLDLLGLLSLVASGLASPGTSQLGERRGGFRREGAFLAGLTARAPESLGLEVRVPASLLASRGALASGFNGSDDEPRLKVAARMGGAD